MGMRIISTGFLGLFHAAESRACQLRKDRQWLCWITRGHLQTSFTSLSISSRSNSLALFFAIIPHPQPHSHAALGSGLTPSCLVASSWWCFPSVLTSLFCVSVPSLFYCRPCYDWAKIWKHLNKLHAAWEPDTDHSRVLIFQTYLPICLGLLWFLNLSLAVTTVWSLYCGLLVNSLNFSFHLESLPCVYPLLT